MNMETKTIKDIREAEERDPFFESSKIPDIIQKKDVGGRLDDYWIDAVMPGITGEWFQISREGNKIIIQPVIISYPDSNRC